MQQRSHATSWAPAEEGARYEQGRPGYPPQAAGVLTEHLGLGPGRWVADVAAGTGKLTRVLTATGAHVVAVEPMPGMRRQLARVQGAVVAAATAEHLPLRTGSLRAVTVAQAFHWFRLPEAAHELRRVVAADGRMAIVTNVRNPGWSNERIGEILQRYEALGPRPDSVRQWRAALDATGAWRRVARQELEHEQRFASWEDFDARFSSISFVILLAEDTRRRMLDELRRAAADLDPLAMPLKTVIEVYAPEP